MLSSRIMVAGAVVMVGAVISSPVRASCDSSFPLTCLLGSDQTAKAKSEAAPAHPRNLSKRPAKAARSSDRGRKHASAHKPRHLRIAKAEPHAAPAVQARQMSAATRRFREFVSPRSIVMNPVDDLKRPRPDEAVLATSLTFPTVAGRLQPPVGSALEDAAFSQDDINELDLAAAEDVRPIKVSLADIALDGVQVATPARSTDVRRTMTQDQAPGGATWLQLIFVTWGGILTLVSAVRLFLG
jgi:hypothetical protein